jgi:uncharacterized protein with FMN-binding domain
MRRSDHAIRLYGSYPEGVSFAILLMNIVTPHIDALSRRRLYEVVQMKTWKEYFSPTAVLTVICIIVTLALAGTYQLTQPVIAANAKAAADAARAEALPDGGGAYSPVDCKLLDGVAEVYQADNKAGYVITAKDKGFGGAIVVMVGIGADGKIAGVKVLEHSETPGWVPRRLLTPIYPCSWGRAKLRTPTRPGCKYRCGFRRNHILERCVQGGE